MDTHQRARDRIFWVLRDHGFSERDIGKMIRSCLADIKKDPANCVAICTATLGLEWEYISPLTLPKQELCLDENGHWQVAE
jgi:hypothetical protein